MPNKPVHVQKRGNKFCVADVGSKTSVAGRGRCHKTRAQAVKQVQAINLSMIKQGTLKPKKR